MPIAHREEVGVSQLEKVRIRQVGILVLLVGVVSCDAALCGKGELGHHVANFSYWGISCWLCLTRGGSGGRSLVLGFALGALTLAWQFRIFLEAITRFMLTEKITWLATYRLLPSVSTICRLSIVYFNPIPLALVVPGDWVKPLCCKWGTCEFCVLWGVFLPPSLFYTDPMSGVNLSMT